MKILKFTSFLKQQAKLNLMPRKSHEEIFLRSLSNYSLKRAAEDRKILEDAIGTSTDIEDVLLGMDEHFDEKFYLEVNDDVRASGLDPRYHYLIWGWREHRPPSAFFDPGFYRSKQDGIDTLEFLLGHYVRVTKIGNPRAHPIGNRRWFTPAAPTDIQWENVQAARRVDTTQCVVVIPVYDGYDETLASIYCALSARGKSDYSLLVVDDRGPNISLRNTIQNLANKGIFDLYINEKNEGFVKTVNNAVDALTGSLDIVLLNSDAYVFDGWFERLANHAHINPKVATVTPLSNNATICSYPQSNFNNFHSLEITAEDLDQLASACNKGLSVEAPTGVGFCFYISRAALDEVGNFDAGTFKVGYGEENDFCIRASQAGYKNLIAGDVLVYHTGSVSFATVNKDHYTLGLTSLLKKHTNYSSTIERHIYADSEWSLRRNLDAERLGRIATDSTIVISHTWGGGIEAYINELQKDILSSGGKIVIIRVHDGHFASFEGVGQSDIFIPNLKRIDIRTNLEFIRKVIANLSPTTLHLNSMVGLDWQSQASMLSMLGDLSLPKIYVAHDFSAISHRYQLLRPDGVFEGIPDVIALEKWSEMWPSQPEIDACNPRERLDTYRRFFETGVDVIVPSNSTRTVFSRFFPSAQIVLSPHDNYLPLELKAPQKKNRDCITVAIVGAIGPHKGSAVVASLAEHAKNSNLKIHFHIIGYSDIDSRLSEAGVRIWGPYKDDQEALDRIADVEPDIILLPSVWPETYCYTLSLAFRANVPPVVFDIGAQAERVKAAGYGVVLPLRLINNPALLSEELISIATAVYGEVPAEGRN